MRNSQSKLNEIAYKTENALVDMKSMLQRSAGAVVEQQSKQTGCRFSVSSLNTNASYACIVLLKKRM